MAAGSPPWPFLRTVSCWPAPAPIKRVIFWDLATGEPAGTLRGHEDYVSAVAFSADGKLLATGSFDHTVKVWDVAGRELLRN